MTPVPDCRTCQQANTARIIKGQTHSVNEDRQVADGSVPLPQATEDCLDGCQVVSVRLYAYRSVRIQVEKSGSMFTNAREHHMRLLRQRFELL